MMLWHGHKSCQRIGASSVDSRVVIVDHCNNFYDNVLSIWSKNRKTDMLFINLFVPPNIMLQMPYRLVQIRRPRNKHISDFIPESLQSVTCTFDHPYLCGYTVTNAERFSWSRLSGATPSLETGPKHDHTSGDSNGRCPIKKSAHCL